MIKDLERPLLDKRASENLNLINRIYSMAANNYKDTIREKYLQLFTGLGRMKAEYTITLQQDAEPYAITVPTKVLSTPCKRDQRGERTNGTGGRNITY